MIYVIVGASCSGKTTFIKNTWSPNEKAIEEKDIIHYTITQDAILIGRYMSDKRLCGCDRISRCMTKRICEQVKRLLKKYGKIKNIVLDGDRITLSSIMDELLTFENDVTLLLITCSQEISIQRNLENGYSNKKVLKAVYTKSLNFFEKYYDKVKTAMYIYTDGFSENDFKHFNIDSLKKFKHPNELFPQKMF